MTKNKINPPKLSNNPSFDVVVTETTPLLSFFNSGDDEVSGYEIQIDSSKDFNSSDTIKIDTTPENGKFVSDFKIDGKNPLQDKKRYYWRVRTIKNHSEKSEWATSRFFVDTTSDDKFMNLTRAKVKNIEVSGNSNAKNIIDYDDQGLVTYWQSLPSNNEIHWIKFDLGEETAISRIWILSNPVDSDGWLKDFYFESSNDGKNWRKIADSEVKDNDTFRNIIDINPTKARYFRLVISDFNGYAAQINEIILYSPGKPALPKIPSENYVLIIGNEHNGFTFTELAKHIERLEFNLKTITIPYYEVSLEILNSLKRKPVAIILSGNNADYPNLPMFEHNGEFEIIRESNIPILGICAGHQFLAMAYGYTRARGMGWSDISAMKAKTRMTKIDVIKKDPIFSGMKEKFVAPEIHSWAVVEPSDEFEIIAKSDYVQAQRSKKRLIYGEQFHAEIDVAYNEGKNFIKNFIELALGKR